MADKSISELVEATSVTSTDLFVLQQSNTAKRLTGQTLENWLVSFADGHGGIQSLAKLSSLGLVDTYRITLADTTTFDFTVTNGKTITSVSKTGTSGLVDTYTIAYNDETESTFTVSNGRGISSVTKSSSGLADTYNMEYNDGTSYSFIVNNGEKGDTGEAWYVHIRYAGAQPTKDSDIETSPDNWIGIYSGTSETSPTTYTSYTWYQYKGEKGDTGDDLSVASTTIRYAKSSSGTIVPTDGWQETVPTISSADEQRFMWTRMVLTFNNGATSNPAYSVSYRGIDGEGAVDSVNGMTGDVVLTASDIQTSDSASIQNTLNSHSAEIAAKQDALTAGTNITIENNVISAASDADSMTYDSTKSTHTEGSVGAELLSHSEAIDAHGTSISNLESTDKSIVGGDAWVSGKSYVVGDTCIYNNIAYRCITATSGTTEPSTASEWEQISLKTLNSKSVKFIDYTTSVSVQANAVSGVDLRGVITTTQRIVNVVPITTLSTLFYSIGYYEGWWLNIKNENSYAVSATPTYRVYYVDN